MKCDKEFCQSLKRLLFVKFWAEVEGKNLNITPEKIINLEKKIYKALHKDVRLTPALLLTLTTEGPIASHCNDRSVCFCMPPLHWRTTFADENEKKKVHFNHV